MPGAAFREAVQVNFKIFSIMATYRIICCTDEYHAARYAGFSRDGMKIEAERLTIEQARRWMLSKANELSDKYFANWSLACMNGGDALECCTFKDGGRRISYDIFAWTMEAEEDE